MTWMIYGANGYTGALLARLAVERGERPILAGRRADRGAPLAAELGLAHRAADLADPVALRSLLDGVAVVAHCAGPYAATAQPMVRACLQAGTHYLDITGELDVFAWMFKQDEAARQAGVVLLTGAGFDVVPTDCLAASLVAALPSAVTLELAFLAPGGLSRGTARTGVGEAAAGAKRRVDGVLVPTPFGAPTRVVPFRSGSRTVGATRWGDLVTAFWSTGIPNITVYTSLPASAGGGRNLALQLLRLKPLGGLARALIRPKLGGPSPERRAATGCEVWAEVRDATGTQIRTAWLTGPNAYALTVDAALRAAGYLLAGVGPSGPVTTGVHTPSSAFGAAFLDELDGVSVGWPSGPVDARLD